MQNICFDMCEKFRNDRLRNDKALILLKSDNNNPKKKHNNNVGSAWGTRFRVQKTEVSPMHRRLGGSSIMPGSKARSSNFMHVTSAKTYCGNMWDLLMNLSYMTVSHSVAECVLGLGASSALQRDPGGNGF